VETHPQKHISYYRTRGKVDGRQVFYNTRDIDGQLLETMRGMTITDEQKPAFEAQLEQWFASETGDNEEWEQAKQRLANLKRNRDKSFGFGKRKWLTSRVICGLCGRRYNLRKNNGCACLRSDPMRAQPPCPNVTIPWRRLSDAVWDTFVECLTSLDALGLAVKDKRRAWKAQKTNIERQASGLQEQINRLQQKRRQYSWQQAEGIITEEELRTAHKQLKSEENIINEQLGRLEEFSGEPAPPDMATFKKLAEYWTWEITSELDDAPDDVRARFAELFDLYATIRPDSSRGGYHFDLVANIPLEMEGDKPGAYDMVFSPSGRTFRVSPLKSIFAITSYLLA